MHSLNIEITTVEINNEGKIHVSFDNLVKDMRSRLNKI